MYALQLKSYAFGHSYILKYKGDKMKMKSKWWKKAVIYQIYPRSFQDSNGDGIGDLRGIIKRLDYLAHLGIDAIWLSPVYASPQDDNGYDISDYKNIDPMFGTMEDMEDLITEAGKKNIRIIMDLVLNHTSDEHAWFMEAQRSINNSYHDYYVWRDGGEDAPPNDLKSVFGGSAWEWVPGLKQYYFHQFSKKQPDLNWENPKLRQELYDMINWWIKKGVGGFRLDVIDQIAKEPDLKITNNGPKLHIYLRELNQKTFGNKDLITVGEAWGATPELSRIFSNPDGSEFSMVFQFEHIGLDQQEGKDKWDLFPMNFVKLKHVFEKWQHALYDTGWNSLFWNNHDLPRAVSRFGNDTDYRVESAKMLATLLHGMQGTPYIYQGEELGMTNVKFSIDQYRDIETLNMFKERLEKGYNKDHIIQSLWAKSRDNARTPMQWDSSQNAGFTEGNPWIMLNSNYKEINAENQVSDPNSVFSYYKRLIQLRHENEVLLNGRFELLFPDSKEIFAYKRVFYEKKINVYCNFTDQNVKCIRNIKKEDILIMNYEDFNKEYLRPYEAMIIKGYIS